MGEIVILGEATEIGPDAVILMLKSAISDIEAGHIRPDKAVLLTLTTDDGGPGDIFKVNWHNAGMRMSECVALVSVAKAQFLKTMGY